MITNTSQSGQHTYCKCKKFLADVDRTKQEIKHKRQKCKSCRNITKSTKI